MLDPKEVLQLKWSLNQQSQPENLDAPSVLIKFYILLTFCSALNCPGIISAVAGTHSRVSKKKKKTTLPSYPVLRHKTHTHTLSLSLLLLQEEFVLPLHFSIHPTFSVRTAKQPLILEHQRHLYSAVFHPRVCFRVMTFEFSVRKHWG